MITYYNYSKLKTIHLEKKLIIYIKAFFKFYKYINYKLIYKIHKMIKFEKIYILTIKNLCNLDIY